MKIKNHEAENFALFLLSLKLKGFENRMRNRLVKIIQTHLKQVQEEHKELLDEYCKKNEKGELNIIYDKDKSYYDVDDVEGFQNEYLKLMNEDLIIEKNESNKELLQTIENIVLSCEQEFSGDEAMQFERYCEIVEDIEIIKA